MISFAVLALCAASLPACGSGESAPPDVGQAQEPLLVSTRAIHGVGGKCLDVMWGDQSDGNRMWLWDCNGSDAQAWTLMPSGEIRTPNGKCLAVPGGNTAEGTEVIVWSCLGYADQKWTVGPDNTLRSIGGKCLTVASSGETGAVAHIETCSSAAGQKWYFPWSTILQNAIIPDQCMCTNPNNNGEIGVGSYILWGSCTEGGVSNRYIFLPTGEIQTPNGLCLTPKNGAAEGPIQLATCNGGSAQKWQYDQPTGEIKGYGGKCIAAVLGTNVLQTRACAYRNGQIWKPLSQP